MSKQLEPTNRITLGRDYTAEMRAHVEAMTNSEESWVAGIVAAKLVALLREQDPELLQGWLERNAEQFVRAFIVARDGTHRAHNRVIARKQTIRSAVVSAEQGDDGPLSSFLNNVYEVAGGERRRLRSMRRDDLQFAAGRYRERAAQNTFVGIFLEALAKQVGDGTVEDHFTEQDLTNMWGSLGSL